MKRKLLILSVFTAGALFGNIASPNPVITYGQFVQHLQWAADECQDYEELFLQQIGLAATYPNKHLDTSYMRGRADSYAQMRDRLETLKQEAKLFASP